MSPRTPGAHARTSRWATRRSLLAAGAAAVVLGGLTAAGYLGGHHSADSAPSKQPSVQSSALAAHQVPRALSLAKSDRASDTSSESDTDGESEHASSTTHKSTKSKTKTKTKTKSKIASASKGPAKKMSVELTGYSWFDNTPAGSSEVSNPVLHKEAGGRGTYADPITVAVADGSFKPGTRFYIPSVQRYVIVEDSGASDGDNHLDMWIGGKGGSESGAKKCMDRITGTTTVEQNPPAGRPVMAGPIYSGTGCHLPNS